MGCTGRDTEKAVSEDQKWAYITLSDFRNKSCLTVTSYVWLWMLVLISIAVYLADTFTAINLLAFNRWSSQVKPALDFKYSKWIFAGAILFSFALLIFEWIQAVRALRRGGVVDSYMDPLAAIVQSIRPGQAQGFRRFLVFTELTKSKKGVNYIALFVYFQFKGAIRVLLAEGPRVVINAMTLWAVMKADLIPEGGHAAPEGQSAFVQFFKNIETLAGKDNKQAVILSAMTFTLVIWVFEIIFLIVALVLYLLFLWHYIPSTDGTLARYCRRKIETRLERIVDKKTQKAILKAETKRLKEAAKASKIENSGPQQIKQPTLPVLGFNGLNGAHTMDDTKSQHAPSRQDSIASLPPYSIQPPTLADNVSTYQRPLLHHRTTTQSSGLSTRSNAPLLAAASPMGYDDPGRSSPVPTLPPLERMNDYFGQDYPDGRSNTPFTRPGTANSTNQGPRQAMRPPPRSNTALSAPGQPSRFNQPLRANVPANLRSPSAPPPDSSWSPYENTASSYQGPSYEMSPVEATPHIPPPSLTPGPLRIGAGSVPPHRSHTGAYQNQGTVGGIGQRSASAAPALAPVASQRQGGGWHGGAMMGTGQFR